MWCAWMILEPCSQLVHGSSRKVHKLFSSIYVVQAQRNTPNKCRGVDVAQMLCFVQLMCTECASFERSWTSDINSWGVNIHPALAYTQQTRVRGGLQLRLRSYDVSSAALLLHNCTNAACTCRKIMKSPAPFKTDGISLSNMLFCVPVVLPAL